MKIQGVCVETDVLNGANVQLDVDGLTIEKARIPVTANGGEAIGETTAVWRAGGKLYFDACVDVPHELLSKMAAGCSVLVTESVAENGVTVVKAGQLRTIDFFERPSR